jgi:Nuclease-related domain
VPDDRRERRASPGGSLVVPPKPVSAMLAGLTEHGYVILDDRRLSFARARLDHVVIGPTGLFVIESRPWLGQLGISNDELFVDGRRRSAATDQITRATAAVEQALGHELKPLGAPVRPVLCVERATPQWFKGTVQGVLVTNGRALPRAIREGEPTLGPETVVRVALAADRLLE